MTSDAERLDLGVRKMLLMIEKRVVIFSRHLGIQQRKCVATAE